MPFSRRAAKCNRKTGTEQAEAERPGRTIKRTLFGRIPIRNNPAEDSAVVVEKAAVTVPAAVGAAVVAARVGVDRKFR